jgi:hypothetical protein
LFKSYYEDESNNHYYEFEKEGLFLYYVTVAATGEIDITKHQNEQDESEASLINQFKKSRTALSLMKLYMPRNKDILTQIRLIKLFNEKKCDRLLDINTASTFRF